MDFLNIFTNSLILLIAASGMAGLMWIMQRDRSTPVAVPALARDGRFQHQTIHKTIVASSRYHMMPASRAAAVDSMDDGMVVLDAQKRIIDINPAACRIIRRPTVEIVGKLLDKVWPDLAERFQAGITEPVDIALNAPSAKHFYEITVTPFFDEQAKQDGHTLVLRDVTERKKREDLREDMTRTMVHDLRDPISNSLFALEMLKTTLADGEAPDARQLLDLTFANTVKTLQLVDRILEICRLESGEMPLFLTAVSLSHMVNNILTAQMPRFVSKRLQLINDIPPSTPRVWADAGLLERILKNLVDNAIKFTPDGGDIRVTTVHSSDSNAETILVSVSDTGPGISEKLQPQIFDQFVTGSHVASGSGLGLAFCKMALAAHGQDVWIDDESEHGATFTFSLPFAPSDAN